MPEKPPNRNTIQDNAKTSLIRRMHPAQQPGKLVCYWRQSERLLRPSKPPLSLPSTLPFHFLNKIVQSTTISRSKCSASAFLTVSAVACIGARAAVSRSQSPQGCARFIHRCLQFDAYCSILSFMTPHDQAGSISRCRCQELCTRSEQPRHCLSEFQAGLDPSRLAGGSCALWLFFIQGLEQLRMSTYFHCNVAVFASERLLPGGIAWPKAGMQRDLARFCRRTGPTKTGLTALQRNTSVEDFRGFPPSSRPSLAPPWLRTQRNCGLWKRSTARARLYGSGTVIT